MNFISNDAFMVRMNRKNISFLLWASLNENTEDFPWEAARSVILKTCCENNKIEIFSQFVDNFKEKIEDARANKKLLVIENKKIIRKAITGRIDQEELKLFLSNQLKGNDTNKIETIFVKDQDQKNLAIFAEL